MIFMIKKKPCMFLNQKSISKLKCFLDGFAAGYSFPNVNSFLPTFQEYIEAKYKCVLTISWSKILISQTENEEKAFDLFFEELEAFLKENNIEIPEIK